MAKAKSVVIDEKNAPAPATGLLFHTAPSGHRDQLALDMLAIILGRGDSSRVYRSLVADNRLAVEAGALSYALEQKGCFLDACPIGQSPVGPGKGDLS
jgi:predicted Zn-dependent peptidase